MQQINPLMIGLLISALALATGCTADDTSSATTESQKAQMTEATQLSENNTAADVKPYMEFTDEENIVAVVTSINHETREVTLTNGEGETVALTVSEEVRNLDQVSAGDRVSLHTVDNLTIQVMDGEGISAGEALVTAATRAEEGEMPGLAASATEAVVFKVEAIDLDAGTYTLSDADGNQQTFTARNRGNLTQTQVGDVVLVTRTSTVVAKVEKLPAE